MIKNWLPTRGRAFITQSRKSISQPHPKGSFYSIFCEKIARKIRRLAYPIILSSLSLTLLNVVDTAMVGRLCPAALAATGLGGLVFLAIIGAIGSIRQSTQALVARRYGEAGMAGCGQVLDNSLAIGFVLGIIFTISSPWLAHLLSPLLSGDSEVIRLLEVYIEYRFLGALFFLSAAVFEGFFNGIGRTRVRMRYGIIVTASNILLDYLLIFGKFGLPRLEVSGAAIASTIALMLGAVYYLSLIMSKECRSRYRHLHLPNINLSRIGKVARLSLPLIVQSFGSIGGFLVFFWLIGRIGTIELAASNIIVSVIGVSFIFSQAIGVAASILVGQNMGAEKFKEAESSVREAVKMGMVAMGVTGIVLMLFPSQILGIFTSSEEVILMGSAPLVMMGAAGILGAIGIIPRFALIGAGNMRFVMLAEIGITCLIYLPSAYLFGIYLGWGMMGAWLGEVSYRVAIALVMAGKWKGGDWKEIRI